MFKNLFKKGVETPVSVDTDVMDVVNKSYPLVVQEIHTEFLTAGDNLLRQANLLLDTLSIPNQEKVDRLKTFGFNTAKQVVETEETRSKIEAQKKIAEVVSYFRVQYPNYKFITREIAEKICKKYNLVLGDVSKYKGFVPEKNLTDIESFFKNHPDDEFTYKEHHSYLSPEGSLYSNMLGNFASASFEISKKQFEDKMAEKKENPNLLPVIQSNRKSNWHHTKRKTILSICAPVKDMDMRGMELNGVFMVKHIPDPIVMIEKVHLGVNGYIIITAWGDEASDEMVVNHTQN